MSLCVHRGPGVLDPSRVAVVPELILGVAVIGMTNTPEARLAREAEMGYATLALATDWDC